MSPNERLKRDAALLQVGLSDADAAGLLALLDELERWNRSYNLTAITGREEMITHHLLDSLAISPDLAGTRVADVGTGAGFPGLPLALLNPQRQFTLIDSTAKKIRFVTHAIRVLGLANATALQARVESLKPQQPFDTVLARAFAPLPQLLEHVTGLCGPDTRVLAMKGRWPQSELEALPTGWHLASGRQLVIPHLEAARCLIVLTRTL